MTGEDTSHWSVKGPLGKGVRFDAKTTQMDPPGLARRPLYAEEE